MGLAGSAHIDALELIQAGLQARLILIAQLSGASVSAQLVDGRIIVAIDGLVTVAVLAELAHVVLDRVGRTVGIVHTVGIS